MRSNWGWLYTWRNRYYFSST